MAGFGPALRRAAVVVGTLALAGAGAVVLSAPAGATTVTDEATFRVAWTNPIETQIDLANDIVLAGGVGCTGVSIRPNTANNPIVLDGHGHTITQQCPNNGVLQQDGTGALTFNNVTITGGATGAGAGLNTSTAAVTVTNSSFSGNAASGFAAHGGAIEDANGNIAVTNSTFSGNTATGNGALGGAIQTSIGNVTVTNSTFSGNTATGSLPGGGAIAESSGNVTVTNSTFSGNTASGDDAGGGAIFDAGGNVTVTNSTFSGNTATGSFAAGGAMNSGNLTLVYATVVSNAAPNGASIGGLILTSFFGSVVALPQGGGTNCAALASTSNGFNFSDDASCGFTSTGDRQSAGDPGLAALANNGGPTQTRLPQSGSPLIDAIPSGSCQADGASGITTDQRGVTRPQGAGCDIGAVEVQVFVRTPAPTPIPTPPPPVAAELPFTG